MAESNEIAVMTRAVVPLTRPSIPGYWLLYVSHEFDGCEGRYLPHTTHYVHVWSRQRLADVGLLVLRRTDKYKQAKWEVINGE